MSSNPNSFTPPAVVRGAGNLRGQVERLIRELQGKMGQLQASVGGVISKSSTQTLTANNTEQAVTFDRVDFDSGAVADTANNRFVVPEGGLYVVSLGVQLITTAVGTNGYFAVEINGSSTGSMIIFRRTTWTTAESSFHSGVLGLAAGDLVTMVCNPMSAAAGLRGNAATRLSCSLSIAKL
jgi:hypothetical protein